jgi:hypothetical protein
MLRRYPDIHWIECDCSLEVESCKIVLALDRQGISKHCMTNCICLVQRHGLSSIFESLVYPSQLQTDTS